MIETSESNPKKRKKKRKKAESTAIGVEFWDVGHACPKLCLLRTIFRLHEPGLDVEE